MLKFDFYFSQFIFHDNRVLTGVMIGIGSFLAIKLNSFIWGVFSKNNGPLGKFIHSTILITAVLLILFIPFDNIQEFRLRFSGACAAMALPLYFLFKRMYQKHKVNYSLVDLLNNKCRIVFESSLFMAFITSLFLLYVDSKDGHYNSIIISISVYFSVVFLLSAAVKFHITRHIMINTMAFYIFFLFIVSGSYEQAKYTEAFLIGGGIWLFLGTIYDVCMLIKYLYNPAKFLKSCQIPEWAKSMFSIRCDSGINYFKYFKHVKIGKTFIQYNSLFNRIDIVMNGEYSVIKNLTFNSTSEDRLFHINDKAIQLRFFTDFFDVSKKCLDDQTDLDRYAFSNIRKIKAYLNASNMEYNELTEADLQVLEMFSY